MPGTDLYMYKKPGLNGPMGFKVTKVRMDIEKTQLFVYLPR